MKYKAPRTPKNPTVFTTHDQWTPHQTLFAVLRYELPAALDDYVASYYERPNTPRLQVQEEVVEALMCKLRAATTEAPATPTTPCTCGVKTTEVPGLLLLYVKKNCPAHGHLHGASGEWTPQKPAAELKDPPFTSTNLYRFNNITPALYCMPERLDLTPCPHCGKTSLRVPESGWLPPKLIIICVHCFRALFATASNVNVDFKKGSWSWKDQTHAGNHKEQQQ